MFFALALASSRAAVAHDVWIEPSSYFVSPQSLVSLSLRVGHPAKEVEPVGRNPRKLVRFVVWDGNQARPVLGPDGGDPAGFFRPRSAGLAVVGYRGSDSISRLPAEKFTAFLVEKGLDAVVELRSARDESSQSGLEKYSRAIKSLICVGDAVGCVDDRRLGFRLEMVVEESPYRLGPGQSMGLRVWFEDQPLAAALVEAAPLSAPSLSLRRRSDDAGRVSLELRETGPWLVTAVHMVAIADDPSADWQSVWSALTFWLGPPP